MTSVLAVIPARGGSKGVPRKNILNLDGIPLIAHTIRAADDSTFLSKTIISTDDEEIAEVSRRFGGSVPFLRPAELARDTSSSVEVAIHALNYLAEFESETFDILVLLQPTTPFRSAHIIDETVRLLIEHPESDSAITVAPMGSCNPYYLYKKKSNSELWEPMMGATSLGKRRQDLESLYIRTGSVYAVRTSYLLREKRIMSDVSLACITGEKEAINIDSKFDLFLANTILDYESNSNRYGE